MPVVAHALTTLSNVKLFLGITGTNDDALLEELIDKTTALVETFLGGRRIKLTTYVDELHDGGDYDVYLDNWPIAQSPAPTLEFRSGQVSSPTFQAFDANSFVIYFQSGFIHFFARTPGRTLRSDGVIEPGNRNLRFTFDAGFAVIPDDIELVAKQVVGAIFNKRNSQGVKRESVEGTSIEYFGDEQFNKLLSDEQRAVLDRYTRLNVGQNL